MRGGHIFFSVFDLFKSYNCNLSCVLRQRCPQQTLVGLKSWIPVWDGNGEPTQFQTALYSITNEHGCNVITVSDMENLLYIYDSGRDMFITNHDLADSNLGPNGGRHSV